MRPTTATVLTDMAVIAALVFVHVPLGNYMAKVVSASSHSKLERKFYKLVGVNPDIEQSWKTYAISVLSFSAISTLSIYLLLRIQHWLPLAMGMRNVSPALAWNTAISFVTNTNWQNYSGESTMGFLAQMAGLAVQNFASAAVGIVVAVALVRGFIYTNQDRLGNFWVDFTRVTFRILLPLSTLAAVVLLLNGVIQNFNAPHLIHTLSGEIQNIPGGPVASQEAIKELGTNGGGFFNANSSHPFENPNAFTNALEAFLLLAIPFSLPRTFGKLVGNKRQGRAILAAMITIFLGSLTATTALEIQHSGIALHAAGAAMEGKETRFGIGQSALFATATTSTSTGAIDAAHESFTPLAGGFLLFNMMLGEVTPGGVGSGLYGMLLIAVLTVFICGLMVGRTPEYLGKKIQPREMKFASLYILATPIVVLAGTAIAISNGGGRKSIAASGPHGLSEILYAFTSAGNNNGSAFAGFTGNTSFLNIALGVAMLLGRFIPILLVLGLAGSLAKQRRVPANEGTLKTTGPLFVTLLISVAVLVVALTYLPAIALGPLAEGIL
jgi:K+-transporting ATPase ATPase A chain